MSLTIERVENLTLQLGQAPNPIVTALLKAMVTPLEAGPQPSRASEQADQALLPPALGEYWTGQGGIYVGTVPAMLGLPARHLVAATEEVQRAWGGYDRETTGADSHVDGVANTKALMADGVEHPAAAWCNSYTADGHSDFHLPSRFDLLMAYLQAPQVFEKEGWYWSSTQGSRFCAFGQCFANGGSCWGGKDSEFRVRAFRWIHFNA